MVRFALAGLAMLALAGASAAEEDNGPALIGLFASTCALRPPLPSELERTASGLGFVGAGGPITPDVERGPRIDIVYSGRLTRRGRSFGLMAYFLRPMVRTCRALWRPAACRLTLCPV